MNRGDNQYIKMPFKEKGGRKKHKRDDKMNISIKIQITE